MTNYAKILKEFQQEGYREDDRLTQLEIDQALDLLADKNANIEEFDRGVAKQIFQQTSQQEGRVILKNYITTIIKGESLLLHHIKKNEQQLRTAPQQQKQQIKYNIQQFKLDHELVRRTFKLQGPALINQQQLQQSRMSIRSNFSGIFSQSTVGRQQSSSLKITFILVLISISMHHFVNLFVYILVLSIFLLNFFDKKYIIIVIYSLGVAIILDLMWIIFEMKHYWTKQYITQHSTLQGGFMKFVYLMTLILMIGKIAIMGLIYKFKSNNSLTKKTFKIFNIRFDLDGANNNNPFSKISWRKRN